MWPMRRNPYRWQDIGNDRKQENIPGWVLSAFAKMPGSQGTRLINSPASRAGESIYLKGRTYLYRIDLGYSAWRIYRRLRHSAEQSA